LDYRTYYDTLERFVKFINENNTSLMNCFKRFDKDNSGTLSKKEFGDALKDLRFGLSEVELDLLFAEFDQDGSDKLTYKEFIKKMRRAGAVSRSKDDEAVLKLFRAIQQSKISVRRAFEIIDRDGSK
jgi:Ca2+-binding EF-hand superfamily protein